MKIIAVMAHPDDAEIWCGGTLILHAERGDTVRICNLTYAQNSIRGIEARRAAERMGCETEFLGLTDTAVRDTEDSLGRVAGALDTFQPDIVITHWFDDMHPDHEGAFRLVRRAIYRVYFRDKMQLPPRVFCCDTTDSHGLRGAFKPDWFVDVDRVWERKTAAINMHASQPVPFFLHMIDRQCRAHGTAAGTEKAEGFVIFPAGPDTGKHILGRENGRKANR